MAWRARSVDGRSRSATAARRSGSWISSISSSRRARPAADANDRDDLHAMAALSSPGQRAAAPRPMARSAATRSGGGWRDPLPWILLLVVFAFWWFGAGTLWRASHWAHYTYLADAFLHGQLHLF